MCTAIRVAHLYTQLRAQHDAAICKSLIVDTVIAALAKSVQERKRGRERERSCAYIKYTSQVAGNSLQLAISRAGNAGNAKSRHIDLQLSAVTEKLVKRAKHITGQGRAGQGGGLRCVVRSDAVRWLFMQSDLMMRELLSALSALFVRSLLFFFLSFLFLPPQALKCSVKCRWLAD